MGPEPNLNCRLHPAPPSPNTPKNTLVGESTARSPPLPRSARRGLRENPRGAAPGGGGCTPSPKAAGSRGWGGSQTRPGVEAGAVGEGAEVVVAHEVAGPDGPRAALGHEALLDAEVGAVPRGFGGRHRRRLAGGPAHQQRRQQQGAATHRTPPPSPPARRRRPCHGGPRSGQPAGCALGGDGREGWRGGTGRRGGKGWRPPRSSRSSSRPC